MVKLTKIYTRSGDDGSTGLGDGSRVSKSSLRVGAYGTVDEANAAIGLAVRACEVDGGDGGALGEIAGELRRIQNDLFDVGADLCAPVRARDERLRVVGEQTSWLESRIDAWNARLAPLRSFVLPGGSAGAAALHLARTIVRRAERCAVELGEREPDATNAESVKYLNRLSDYLFVVSRVANGDGAGDVLWVPGAGRGGDGGAGGR